MPRVPGVRRPLFEGGEVPGSSLAQLALSASTCTACRLADGRTTVVFGVGDPDADLLVVGEGPGQQEDLTGEPFVGRSGRLLDTLISEEVGKSSGTG